MKEEKELHQEFSIELPEDVAEGIYSNLAIINHSNSEFVLDFIRLMPGIPKAKVKSRLVMTPQNAKRLLLALNDNILRFEEFNGEINIDLEDGKNTPPFPMNFGGPAAEA